MKRKTKKKPVRRKSVRLAGKDFVWEPVNPAFAKPATEQEIASALSRAVQAEHQLSLAKSRVDQLVGERDTLGHDRDICKRAAVEACELLHARNSDWVQDASDFLGDWWKENGEAAAVERKRKWAEQHIGKLGGIERAWLEDYFAATTEAMSGY
jgi:hypothetical protein